VTSRMLWAVFGHDAERKEIARRAERSFDEPTL
jgi:hypothetical protein